MDEENGCMMFVPGSHKFGKLTEIDLSSPQNIYDYVKDHPLSGPLPPFAVQHFSENIYLDQRHTDKLDL